MTGTAQMDSRAPRARTIRNGTDLAPAQLCDGGDRSRYATLGGARELADQEPNVVDASRVHRRAGPLAGVRRAHPHSEQLGKDVGLTTLAEGVECFEHADHLRREDVRAVQSFLFAQPMPAAAVECHLLATGDDRLARAEALALPGMARSADERS
jgi:hypothetical protein